MLFRLAIGERFPVSLLDRFAVMAFITHISRESKSNPKLLSPCGLGYSNEHDVVKHTIPSPAAEPAYLPVSEARAQSNRRTKTKVFGFQLHVRGAVHTFMALKVGTVKFGSSEG